MDRAYNYALFFSVRNVHAIKTVKKFWKFRITLELSMRGNKGQVSYNSPSVARSPDGNKMLRGDRVSVPRDLDNIIN